MNFKARIYLRSGSQVQGIFPTASSSRKKGAGKVEPEELGRLEE